jgi:hypothetical protein
MNDFTDGMVDAALWKRQFGVSLLRGGTETESDFYALDGDAPAALAARVVLRDCAEHLVTSGAWAGATLSHHKN